MKRIKRESSAQSPQKSKSQRCIQRLIGTTQCARLSIVPLCSASKKLPSVSALALTPQKRPLCAEADFTMQSSPLVDSSPVTFTHCPRTRPQAPPAGPQPHSPAACLCSLASLSMLKGSLGASRRSQDGHTEAPGHLFDALVGEGVTAARAACSWSSRDPTPIFKGSLGPPPVRDRKGRGGEIRRLD